MIGFKKILAVTFILFLFCFNLAGICSGRDAGIRIGNTECPQLTSVDQQHTSPFDDFVMELINEERSEKSSADLLDPVYPYEFSKLYTTNFNKPSILLREFYSGKIKSVTSESSFLMIFRI